MNVIRPLTLVLVLGLAACASSQPYPWDYREAETADGRTVQIIGADIGEVCEAIADRTCEGADVKPGCTARVLERCNPEGGGRLEYADADAYHRDWWACLDAIGDSPRPRWGTTRPPACVRLTPFWHPLPVTPTPRYWRAVPFDTARWQPIPSACVPTADGCAPGMTCRMLGAHVGQCRQPGHAGAGELCAATSDCGYAMHCAQAADGFNRCGVICDVWSTTRCEAGHPCEPYVSEDVGLCVP